MVLSAFPTPCQSATTVDPASIRELAIDLLGHSGDARLPVLKVEDRRHQWLLTRR
jgi:hypothetical protein